MRTRHDTIRVLALTILGVLAPVAARAVTIAGPVPEPADWNAPASAQPCSGCHGVDGNSRLEFIPRLAGLDAGYIAKQMGAFRTTPIPPTIQLPSFLSGLAGDDAKPHDATESDAAAHAASTPDSSAHHDGESLLGFFGRVFRIGFVDRKPPPGGRSDGPAQANMIGIAHATSADDVKDIAAWYAKQTPAPGTTVDDPELIAAGKKLFDDGLPSNGVPPCSACHGPTAGGMGPFPRLAGQPAPYLRNQLQAFADGMRTHAAPMGQVARHLDAQEIAAVAAYLQSL